MNLNDAPLTLPGVPRTPKHHAVIELYLSRKLNALWQSSKMSQMALAKRAGVSDATINNIIHTKGGLNAATVEQIAKLWAIEPDELYREAFEWWRKEGRSASPPMQPGDKYPSRAPVLEMARKSGYPAETMQRLATQVLATDEDPGADYWLAQLLAISAQVRTGVPASGSNAFEPAPAKSRRRAPDRSGRVPKRLLSQARKQAGETIPK